jgi:CRP/FNR family cyclic AMP-dependent transcriptional regulator
MRRPVNTLTIFRNHPVFGKLPRASIEQLGTYLTKRKVQRGTAIFRKGDAGSELIAILSGSVKISAPGADGREAVLNLIREGEIFGEIALLDGRPRTADAVAMSDCELMVIERRAFTALLREHSELAFKVIEILCARLRQTSEQVEDLMFLDLPTRLAKAVSRRGWRSLAAKNLNHAAGVEPAHWDVAREHQQTAAIMGIDPGPNDTRLLRFGPRCSRPPSGLGGMLP